MLSAEKLLPLVEAVELATGRRPHLSTVLRWSSRGCLGIRLETALLGGRRLTSAEAVKRYVAAVTAKKDGQVASVNHTPRELHLSAQRSAERLAALVG